MTVLRSRQILPSKSTTKALRTPPEVEPSTPTRTHEPSIRQSPPPPMSSSPDPSPKSARLGSDSLSVSGVIQRRSLRLASKSDSREGSGSRPVPGCKRKSVSVQKGPCLSGNRVERESADEIGGEVSRLVGSEEVGSHSIEKRDGVLELGMSAGLDRVCRSSGNGLCSEEEKDPRGSKSKGKKRKLGIDLNLGLEDAGDGEGCINLRSGKRLGKKGMGGIGTSVVDERERREDEGGEDNKELGRELIGISNDNDKQERPFKSEGKGKGKFVLDDLGSRCFEVVELSLDPKADNLIDNAVKIDGSNSVIENEKGKRKLVGAATDGDAVIQKGVVKGRRRFSREEKGKGVAVDGEAKVESDLDSKARNSGEVVRLSTVRMDENRVVQTHISQMDHRERFREIARENASRFALYNPGEEEEDLVSSGAEAEREFEDWPGPFSTAMKIIKDRATKSQRVESSYSDKSKASSVIWVPRCSQSRPKRPASLKELSLKILAKNVDEIKSLENIPDAFKHKLSQLLCDSRRMNNHAFELLVHGSPTEVRLRDCSWLTEEQFTKSLQECDTSNLVVLQLDQCGRCLPDYILFSTLAQSPNSLPALTTLSLSGACRLTDVGLGRLVSSAPAIRSLNLSQCSLLTSSSIDTLANSLGPILRELYLADCQSIDTMLILPALEKFEQLQVLSLAGIQNVCDDFLRKFMTVRGHNMKELVLTDCVKLTDSSLKVIAETCPGLCAIDLGNLYKLTDSAIGYLANGCRAIQTLKLRRNTFSDEAIAAFLEMSGEWLKELSLNNVKKVSHNTALSLARRSRRLHTLDLSWCRGLSDEAVGLIVDSCLSLRLLKLFGCTQITNVFLDGHSNPDVQIVGLKMSPVFEHVQVLDYEVEGPLHYSLASSPI